MTKSELKNALITTLRQRAREELGPVPVPDEKRDRETIDEALRSLRSLGAACTYEDALKAWYRVKEQSSWNPVIEYHNKVNARVKEMTKEVMDKVRATEDWGTLTIDQCTAAILKAAGMEDTCKAVPPPA